MSRLSLTRRSRLRRRQIVVSFWNQIMTTVVWFFITLCNLVVKYKNNRPHIQSVSSNLDRYPILHRYAYESDTMCLSQPRMNRRCFTKLCGMLETLGGLKYGRFMNDDEQVAIFLHMIARNVKNRVLICRFHRSGETISRLITPVFVLVVFVYFFSFPCILLGQVVVVAGLYIYNYLCFPYTYMLHEFCKELTNSACMVSDLEKQGANNAMSNIFSMLTHYSQLTGRLVSDKRCCSNYMSRVGASLNISLGRIKQSFVLTDPHKTDIPIVYASDAFLELTGYARHEVLGRSSRFLSGQETNELQIRNSIQTGKACSVCILNYRKDGSPFWNSLYMSPVRNASGKITYFVEVQSEMNANDNEDQNWNLRQLGVVGAVKVAVRSCGMIATTSNS